MTKEKLQKKSKGLAKNTFIWCSQFSRDQFKKHERIKQARYWLENDLLEKSKFARWQLISEESTRLHFSFDGEWEGEKVEFDVNAFPLYVDCAIRMYRKAINMTYKRYPNWNEMEIHDGKLIGERIIEFVHQLDEAAGFDIYQMYSHMAWDEDLRISESYSVYPKIDKWTKKEDNKMILDIYLNVAEITDEDRKKIESCFSKGIPYPISDEKIKCDEIKLMNLLSSISLPELVMLNWEECRKPYTEKDKALFKAIDDFDYDKIINALKDGADPNCCSWKYDETPLTTLAVYNFEGKVEYEEEIVRTVDIPAPDPKEINKRINLLVEYGASVNWAGLNENTPLSEASLNGKPEVIEHLLKLGSDPSIECYTDNHYKHGTAWEFADYRCNPHSATMNDDFSVWEALQKYYPSPYYNYELVNKKWVNTETLYDVVGD
ncbi:MAG: hypothetical protein H8E71_08350 [Candidatus Marinimicrobia bacterium]|nr:hypothetical protein [Candidatus Neomarinimicrobiota bacterium]